MSQKSTLYLGIVLLLAIVACQVPTDIEISKSNLELAVPVFHTQTSIADILQDSKDSTAVKVYPDNRMSLIYEGELVRRTTADILGTIPDTLVPLLDTSIFTASIELLDGVSINEADIKSGHIHFQFTNNSFEEDIKVQFRMFQLKNNGEIFSPVFNIPYTGSLPFVYKDSVNLAGWNLEVPDNELSIQYAAWDADNNPIWLPFTTLYDHHTFLKDIVFAYVEGHWNQVNHDFEEETIHIDFFENQYVSGEVAFDDPRVDFTVISSFGLPVRTKVNYFRIVNIDDSVVDMQSDELEEGIDFNYPALSEVGETKSTYFTFDKTNSNLNEIINTNPKRVEYDIDVTVNPGNVPGSIGFATDSSYFSMLARAEFPLSGTVNKYLAEKEYAIDFDDRDVDEATLKIVVDNEVPLGMELQLYFLDEAGVTLDSISNTYLDIIPAAEVSSGNYVRSHSETEIPISSEKWDRISSAKSILMRGYFTTSDDANTVVTFLATQAIDLKVGIKLKVKA